MWMEASVGAGAVLCGAVATYLARGLMAAHPLAPRLVQIGGIVVILVAFATEYLGVNVIAVGNGAGPGSDSGSVRGDMGYAMGTLRGLFAGLTALLGYSIGVWVCTRWLDRGTGRAG